MTLLLGAIADDFNGATDLASMLTRGVRAQLGHGLADAQHARARQ